MESTVKSQNNNPLKLKTCSHTVNTARVKTGSMFNIALLLS